MSDETSPREAPARPATPRRSRATADGAKRSREKARALLTNAPVRRGGSGPPDGGDGVDRDAVKRCAALDLSDTYNAQRLIAHFGHDLVIAARDGTAGGDWLSWEGRYWDHPDGVARSIAIAQQVGPRIALEIEYLVATREEREAITAADALARGDDSAESRATRARATTARAAIKSRRLARWRFSVTSTNAGRVKAMLAMAEPHLRRSARAFNGDPLLLVTNTHTLRFVVEDDLECPDPAVRRKKARVEATEKFERADYATGLAPCAYDPNATCPKFMAFLAECLPDPALARTVQVYSAMGLLGVLAQRLMFHHGNGANGKSVFLATLLGVIGPSLSVGLPKETIMGQGERGAGQASPDLVRLFGRRMVRIDEMKEGEVLREELVKRLTGGDPMVVRGLYQGYLEFPNVATPHMTGNGFPKIDGTDNGIWRRMLVVHWGVTIPPERRRDFDEIVADLLTECQGILNWLIAGAIDYLENGLFVAPAAAEATAEYRADMDPVSEFRARGVIAAPGERVQASRMCAGFKAWATANARTVFSATRFGREMKRLVPRDDERVRSFLDVALAPEILALMPDAERDAAEPFR